MTTKLSTSIENMEINGMDEINKCKIIVIGYGAVGKTTLIRALAGKGFNKIPCTDGVEVSEFSVTKDSKTMTFYFWDFAGQDDYYSTHRFFMSKNCIVLLAWKMTDLANTKMTELSHKFWLDSIQMIVSKCPVIVVGTHADECNGAFPSALLSEYKNIKASIAISSKSNQGIEELKSTIFNVALNHPPTQIIIPKFTKNLIKWISKLKETNPVLLKKEFIQIISKEFEEFKNEKDISKIWSVLNDLGIIMDFENLVILDPNWLNQLFTSVVTGVPNKKSKVLHGILNHDNLPWNEIVKNIPFLTNEILLKMMFSFKIAFPRININGEIKSSLIPSMLDDRTKEANDYIIKSELNLKRRRINFFLNSKLINYVPNGFLNFWMTNSNVFTHLPIEYCFKTECIYEENGLKVLISIEQHQYIDIFCSKLEDPEVRISVIEKIITEMKSICKNWEGLTIQDTIPCDTCNNGHFNWKVLRQYTEKIDQNIMCNICGGENPLTSVLSDDTLISKTRKFVNEDDIRIFVKNVSTKIDFENIQLLNSTKLEKGLWKNSIIGLKACHVYGDKNTLEKQYKEIQLLQNIPNHPNVSTIIGVCKSHQRSIVLTEWSNSGTLEDLLKSSTLNIKDVLNFFVDISNGMKHIHEQNIVHGEIIPKNIMVDKIGNIICLKIASFGSGSNQEIETKVSSKQSDIWAFGVLMCQILLNTKSIYKTMTFEELMKEIDSKIFASSNETLKKLKNWISRCFEIDPSQRPSFSSLYAEITEYQKEIFYS